MLAKDERTRRETQDRLCRLLRNHIQGVIYQRLQHPDQDLAQHIAMEILRGIHRFRGESKFSTWAHEVAKRQIALHLREKYSNREDITPEGIIEVSDDPTEALENQMLFDRIADALPEEDRALLNAKRDGLDSEQIAQILGVSQATVWQRWLRLQEKIRKEFAR